MADKFIFIDGNNKAEREATTSSTGVAEAGDIIALDPTGKIDPSLLPNGIGANVKMVVASEGLASGAFVNIYDNGGVENCRNADAVAPGKEASGFVLSAYSASDVAMVYLDGTNNQLAGLTPGAAQFLDTTAGQATETAPAATGNIWQVLGEAISATEISFKVGEPITRA